MLVGARQLVEQRGLSTVLLTRQGKSKLGAFRKRFLMGLVVIDTFLTQTWVGVMVVQGTDVQLLIALYIARLFCRGLTRRHFNQSGISLAQRKGIAMYHHLHRVAQRRIFH